jgi:hypothetical protein
VILPAPRKVVPTAMVTASPKSIASAKPKAVRQP